jgi:phage tail-like protein
MAVIGANIGLSTAARSRELRVDPYLSHTFIVEIAGILAGGFTEISGLHVETETFEYREGGLNNAVHRFAGQTSHPPLVLKHGLSPIDGLWSWHQDVVAGVIQRRNGTIYLLNAQSTPLMWWDFKDALPVKWSGPELSAASSAVGFETVEIVHRGLVRPRSAVRSAGGIAAEFATRLNLPGGFF